MPAKPKTSESVKEAVFQDVVERLSVASADLGKFDSSIKKLISSIDKSVKVNEDLTKKLSSFGLNLDFSVKSQNALTKALNDAELRAPQQSEGGFESQFSKVFDTTKTFATEAKFPNLFFKSFNEIFELLRNIDKNTASAKGEVAVASEDPVDTTIKDVTESSDIPNNPAENRTVSPSNSDESEPSFIAKDKVINAYIIGY